VGIMKAWENLSRKLYSSMKVASMQKRYDEIHNWTDEDFKKICGELWSLLPADIQKKTIDLVANAAKKYGEDIARAILKSLTSIFKKAA